MADDWAAHVAVDYTRAALEAIAQGRMYTDMGWSVPPGGPGPGEDQ